MQEEIKGLSMQPGREKILSTLFLLRVCAVINRCQESHETGAKN